MTLGNFRKLALAIILVLPMLLHPQPGFASQTQALDSSASLAPGDIGWKAGFLTNGLENVANAVVVDGRNVYVAGGFGAAGNTAASLIAMWDGTKWSALGEGVDDNVTALALDGRGHLYAGGYFKHAGGKPANSIARWDGQEWMPLGDGITGYVFALAVDPSGNVYVGGDITKAGGVDVEGIAMWDGYKWNSLAGGVSSVYIQGVVNAIAIDKFGFVYVGGRFTLAGGTPAMNIARWDGNTWSGLGEGIIGRNTIPVSVNALATDDRGNLYAGGLFDTAGGIDALNVARWNGDTWSALGGGVSAPSNSNPVVLSLLADGGDIYASGIFISAGGIPVQGIARWDGSGWENINAGDWYYQFQIFSNGDPYVSVESMAMDRDGKLFAVGEFKVAGGKSANYVAVWDGLSWSALGTDNSVDGGISDMLPDGKGGFYIGGGFISAGGNIVNRIAHWDGSSWTGLGGGVKGGDLFGGVDAMALDSHGNLYVGGIFNQAGSSPANNIAKWDGNSWDSMGGGVSGPVVSLAIDQQDHLYVGGYFSTAGSVTASNIAMWTGTGWGALGSGLNGETIALAVDPGGGLIAAGNSHTNTGYQPNPLERWDGQNWEVIGDPEIGFITFLGYKGNTLYIGSDRVWTLSNGILNQVGDPFFESGITAIIRSITFDSKGRMVVGGIFERAGNGAISNIARWNGINWENLGSGANYWGVNSIVTSGDTLLVGGNFYQAGDKISMYFAQWNDPFYQWLPVVWK